MIHGLRGRRVGIGDTEECWNLLALLNKIDFWLIISCRRMDRRSFIGRE